MAQALFIQRYVLGRAHCFNISDTNIAQAMRHTVEVHHRSYRTSEWKTVRRAFAQAS